MANDCVSWVLQKASEIVPRHAAESPDLTRIEKVQQRYRDFLSCCGSFALKRYFVSDVHPYPLL
jgi:hypothetical protein